MTLKAHQLLMRLSILWLLGFSCLPNVQASDTVSSSIFDLGKISFATRGDSRLIPNGVIMSMIQDSRGFIWMGTQSGVVRYDGYSFTLHQHLKDNNNSISGNFVRALWGADNGDIWIGSFSDGVTLYNSDEEKFTRFQYQENDTNSLSDNTVLAIVGDNRGHIFDRGRDQKAPPSEPYVRFSRIRLSSQ